MTHFVVYARKSTFSDEEIEQIRGLSGLKILDEEMDGALLVDTTSVVADKLRKLLPGCVIAREVEYPPPQLHPHRIEEDDK